MLKNAQSVNYSFQNLIFIKIKRKTLNIDLLVNVAQINNIMIIKIEFLTIIKFIFKTIELKQTLMKEIKESPILNSIYIVV